MRVQTRRSDRDIAGHAIGVCDTNGSRKAKFDTTLSILSLLAAQWQCWRSQMRSPCRPYQAVVSAFRAIRCRRSARLEYFFSPIVNVYPVGPFSPRHGGRVDLVNERPKRPEHKRQ